MSLNEIRCLPSCGSTNTYAKEHIEEFGPVAAVYTTSQTSGRGRLGRLWTNAAGKALYYTAVLKVPMVQPETLPLFASLAVREQLRLRYGVECAIKWPNDLLLGGKKVVGILCEAVNYGTGGGGRAYLWGIGINPGQPQSHFDAAGLPYRTPPAPPGANVGPRGGPSWPGEGPTDFGFDRELYIFGPEGFAPYREEYTAACVNLGRQVSFNQGGHAGTGTATGIDSEGRLIVRTDSGEERVFTGEVSIHGIYGHL